MFINIAQHLPANANTILEVGCGSGFFLLVFLSVHRQSAVGIDYSNSALKFAELLRKQADAISKLELILGDFEEHYSTLKAADVVVSIGVLEHYPPTDQRRLLSLMIRKSILGTLVVVPNLLSMESSFSSFSKEMIEKAIEYGAHHNQLGPEIRKQAEWEDFSCVQTYSRRFNLMHGIREAYTRAGVLPVEDSGGLPVSTFLGNENRFSNLDKEKYGFFHELWYPGTASENF